VGLDALIERVGSEGGNVRAKGAVDVRAHLLQPRMAGDRRMDYLRSLFGAFCPDEDEVEARCMLAFSLLIGNHFIAADHGARSRADVLGLAARRLLA